MNKINKILVYTLLFTTLGLTACDGDHIGGTSGNSGGMLSRDGDNPVPLFITNTSVKVNGNTTATISLANWWITQGGTHNELIQSIHLTIPLNKLGQEVALDAISASMEEFPPTELAGLTPPVTEEFQSVSAIGKATLFYAFEGGALLNPDHASGVFQVVFTDADGHTREISNGFFNF